MPGRTNSNSSNLGYIKKVLNDAKNEIKEFDNQKEFEKQNSAFKLDGDENTERYTKPANQYYRKPAATYHTQKPSAADWNDDVKMISASSTDYGATNKKNYIDRSSKDFWDKKKTFYKDNGWNRDQYQDKAPRQNRYTWTKNIDDRWDEDTSKKSNNSWKNDNVHDSWDDKNQEKLKSDSKTAQIAHGNSTRVSDAAAKQSLNNLKTIEQGATVKAGNPNEKLKWKSHVPLFTKDKNWINVFIQSVNLPKSGSKAKTTMFVTPIAFVSEVFEYLEKITNFYKDIADDIQFIEPNNLNVGDLVIYPFDDDFLYRAEVISINPALTFRLIDFGNEFVAEKGKKIFPAIYSEKTTLAYGIEVQVQNPEILPAVKDETDVLIKLIEEDPKVVIVELKGNKDLDSKKSPAKNETKVKPKDPENGEKDKKLEFVNDHSRFMANNISHRGIRLGSNVKILVLDASNLKINELTACEYNNINMEFYNELDKEIASYCEKNKSMGYAPIPREIILAEYRGYFCRAICLSIENSKANVIYLDYGNKESNIDISRIMKLPMELLYPSCAIKCQIRGIEEKIKHDYEQVLKKIDNQVIEVKVEKVKGDSGRYIYCLTLDL